MKRNKLLKYSISPFVRLYMKRVRGINNIPKKEPFIIVANHNSVTDDFAILSLMVNRLKNKVGGIARFKATTRSKRERFLVKVLEKFCCYFFCIVSVFETNVVERVVKALEDGNSMIVFPEGYYNTDKKNLMKAKTGAARIALKTGVPILPIGILGSEDIVPANKLMPRFKRLSLNIGKPMTFDKYVGKDQDKEIVLKVTKEIMLEIGRLCNKKYPY